MSGTRTGPAEAAGRGSRLLSWVGALTILLGVVHVLSAVLLYPGQLARVAGSGFAGLYGSRSDETNAFWSVLFGVMVAAAGQQILWAARRHRVISIIPGVFLLAIGLVGGWYVPFAPFWIAAALGVVVIVTVLRRRAA